MYWQHTPSKILNAKNFSKIINGLYAELKQHKFKYWTPVMLSNESSMHRTWTTQWLNSIEVLHSFIWPLNIFHTYKMQFESNFCIGQQKILKSIFSIKVHRWQTAIVWSWLCDWSLPFSGEVIKLSSFFGIFLWFYTFRVIWINIMWLAL